MNPIIPGFHPDPSCICVDGIFYLVNSTFQWFPHISVQVSQDLINWIPCSHQTEGILAPTIRYYKGTFYVICTNILLTGKAETFIVSSTSPIAGKWSAPIQIDFHGIDPSLFFDPNDDKVYFQGTMFPKKPADGKLPEGLLPQIVQMEIDIKTGESLSGSPKPLMKAHGRGWAEGPHVYTKDGWYYGLLAEDGTEINHCVTMFRSRSVWGPFESHPQNPVLTARGTDEYVQGVGHADLFQDEAGNWWAVMLAVRLKDGRFPLGRETFLCPVTWPEGEWPVFNNSKKIGMEHELCQPLPVPNQTIEFFSKAVEETLTPTNPRLVCLRDPDFSSYDWHEGGVSIVGKAANLHTPKGTSSLVGFRQRSLNAQVSIDVLVQPSSDNEEAGLSVYVDQLRHFDVSVRGNNIVFSVSSLQQPTKSTEILRQSSSPRLSFRVRCTESMYAFDVKEEIGGEKWREIGTADPLLISEWGYTGPVFALFATSNGEGDTKPVVFENLVVE
ncbi:glycoside hydrolase family 43 protein [Cadophora sp. DSE1049]|nr:glycoside hydrolase family 43 protein [Cadophora sp. DSE1049]